MEPSIEAAQLDHGEQEETAAAGCSSTAPLSKIGLKAGMQGLDKAKVNQIIFEASKGSRFHDYELRKDEQITKKIKLMMERVAKVTAAQTANSLKTVDKEIEVLERTRDLNRTIVHVDMDAFYAAVEMRDNPQLRNVPMAVGGTGMLSTSNYLARRFGVRAAMPGFIGKKLCPELTIVAPNYDKYRQVSAQVQEVLAIYDPHFCSMGLDEAYLDLTTFIKNKLSPESSLALVDEGRDAVHGGDSSKSVDGKELLPTAYWQCAEVTVEELRHAIFTKTGLTASAGIAPNKMLAKVASDVNKPDGQYLVSPTRESVLDFIQKLPIRKIGGIGKVTERMLNALGVTTCGDLYKERAMLHLLFSQISMQSFLRICLGIGSVEVYREYERKSISTERTFSDMSNPEELQRKCHELCVYLGESVEEEGVMGRTVTLKLKTSDFEVKSRSSTLLHPVSTADEIYHSASELLRLEIMAKSPTSLCLRLMGVRLSSLENRKTSLCRQGTLKELFQQQASADYPTKLQTDVEHSTAQTDIECTTVQTDVKHSTAQTTVECTTAQTDMATCPVCNQLVLAENTIFNQHIDECLNCSAIKETLSDGSISVHQSSVADSSSGSPSQTILSPSKLQGSDHHHCPTHNCSCANSSPSSLVHSRKRKASGSTTHKAKRLTLDHYFNSPCKQKH